MSDLDLPGGDCTRGQLDKLVALIERVRTEASVYGDPYNNSPGVIDVSTFPFAEQHLMLCLAALDQAQRHAQLAAYLVSRGE